MHSKLKSFRRNLTSTTSLKMNFELILYFTTSIAVFIENLLIVLNYICTVVELYREWVTKLFHQMEVNETFILFYIWQMKENTLLACQFTPLLFSKRH